MADGTPSAAPREYKAGEVLSSMGEVKSNLRDKIDDTTNPEQARRIDFGQRRAKDIRETAPQASGREIFRKNLERGKKVPEFDPDNKDALVQAFGNGEKNPRGEFKDARDEAGKVVTELTGFLSYSQIRSELNEPGAKIPDILTKHGIPDRKALATFRQTTLDSLINSSYFQETFGDTLNAFPDAESKRAFVEQTLLSKPDLAKKISQKLSEVSQKKDGLPKIKEDPATEGARATIDQEQARIDQSTKQVIESAKLLGFMVDGAGVPLTDKGEIKKKENELKKMVKDHMASGTDADIKNFSDTLRTVVINSNPDVKLYNNYMTASGDIEGAKAELDAMTDKTTPEAVALTAEITNLEAAHATTLTDYATMQADTARFTSAKSLSDRINAMTVPNVDGKYTSRMAQSLAAISESNGKIATAEGEIAANGTKAGTAQEQARQTRLREENKLIQEMQEIMGLSITEIMEEQYDDILEADLARMEQEGSDDAKKLADKMKNNWITYDRTTRRENRKKNRDQMKDDMSYLIYNGEDGVKQLILRDLDILPTNSKDWEGADFMDKLTEEQQNQLTAAYDKFGKDYTKKLMTDFFMARGSADRTVGVFGAEIAMGKLALKEHEWKKLHDNFGGVENLSKIFASAQSGSSSEVMNALREQGIVPDSPKAKWILAILAALGMVVAAPIGLAVASGAGAAAIGAGAMGATGAAGAFGSTFDLH